MKVFRLVDFFILLKISWEQRIVSHNCQGPESLVSFVYSLFGKKYNTDAEGQT